MLLMIDNYDSFTYNLVQYFMELGEEVSVYRNDEISLAKISQKNPDKIVISPGPCTPNEAGVSLAVIKKFAGQVPLLGVCLGHQAIGQAFGAKVVRADRIMHGKTSLVYHDGHSIFDSIKQPFEATRYHSLVVERASLPDCFEISAWTKEQEIMGLRHKELLVEGIQFHPESILTRVGKDILRNFLQRCSKFLTNN